VPWSTFGEMQKTLHTTEMRQAMSKYVLKEKFAAKKCGNEFLSLLCTHSFQESLIA
jgi:hypothetical protein